MSSFLESLFPCFFKDQFLRWYSFNRLYRGVTPFGFIAPYRLHGHLSVVDEDEFFEACGRSKRNIQSVVDEIIDYFHNEIFLPLIEQRQQFFLYTILPKYFEIRLSLWQYTQLDDHRLQIDWKPYYSVGGLASSDELALGNFRRNGCQIRTLSVDCEPYQTNAIAENIRMIPQDILAMIRESGLHLKLVEQFCVAALAERMALFYDQKTYGQNEITIQTQIIGDALKLSWKNTKASEGWKLLGFRKTGGYDLDDVSETKNGLLVVDSATQEGETVEATLPCDEPVYYTFFLKKQEKPSFWLKEAENLIQYEPVARFTVTMPDEGTAQALAKQLEETRLKAQIVEAEHKVETAKKGKPSLADTQRQHMESQLRLAKDALGLLKAVDQIEADAIAEFERSPDRFSAERAEVWQDEVIDLCAKLRENVRRLV